MSTTDYSSDSSSDEDIGQHIATHTLPTAQLHSLRIRDHVLAVLDFDKENYGLWRRQFLTALAKFGLLDHVDGSPSHATSDWVLHDYAVVSWYHATVTPSTMEIVEDRHNTARSLWRSIRALFRNSHDARATYLLDDFHSFS
jgi:sulfate adenylyltransferase subunit 1 (EFTu-like GTPase family)